MKSALTLYFAPILFFALAFGAVCSAQAQEDRARKSPEERAERMTERMKTELALDDAQTAKVKEINLKYAKERDALREKEYADRREKGKAMRASFASQDKEIEPLLNDEQRDKYQELKDEMRENMQERRRERRRNRKG